MVEMGTEVKMALPVVIDTIPINLVVDMVVIMVLMVEVIVFHWMVHMELVQRAPHLQTLKEDADVIAILNNMTNSSKV